MARKQKQRLTRRYTTTWGESRVVHSKPGLTLEERLDSWKQKTEEIERKYYGGGGVDTRSLQNAQLSELLMAYANANKSIAAKNSGQKKDEETKDAHRQEAARILQRFPTMKVSSFGISHATQLRDWLETVGNNGRPYSASVIKKTMWNLRSSFWYAFEERRLSVYLFDKKRIGALKYSELFTEPESSTVKEFNIYTEDEEARLLADESPEKLKIYTKSMARSRQTMRLALWFERKIGARVGEVAGFKWGDINWDDGEPVAIKIERNMDKHGSIKQLKGGHEYARRLVAIVESLRPMIKEHRDRTLFNASHIPEGERLDWLKSQFIFGYDNGKPRTPRDLYQFLYRLCSSLGIECRGTHALRRARGSELYHAGLRPDHLSRMLGHVQGTNVWVLYANPFAEKSDEIMNEYIMKIG